MWSFSKKVAAGLRVVVRGKSFLGRPGRQGEARGSATGRSPDKSPSPFLKTDRDHHKLQADTPFPNNVSNKRKSFSCLPEKTKTKTASSG